MGMYTPTYIQLGSLLIILKFLKQRSKVQFNLLYRRHERYQLVSGQILRQAAPALLQLISSATDQLTSQPLGKAVREMATEMALLSSGCSHLLMI
jgi:hypothetical protein